MISSQISEILNFAKTAHTAGKCCLLLGDVNLREQTLVALAAREGVEVFNVSQILAELITQGEAPSPRLFQEAVSGRGCCFLDHIELLFLPSLKIDPLEFLVRVGRHQPVCVSWPGTHENGRLRYASAEHPECFDDSDRKAIVVDLNKRKNA